jgi:hypothetical protein
MSKARSGGGPSGKNVTSVGMHTGAARRAQNPAFAKQLGTHVGNHSEGRVAPPAKVIASRDAGPALPSILGNALATNVGKGGPGAGRTVYATGVQGQHGAHAPGTAPPSGSVFAGWEGKRHG